MKLGRLKVLLVTAVAIATAATVMPPNTAPAQAASISVKVTAPKYESAGGTVPIIITAFNAGSAVARTLTASATSGAKVSCTATSWYNSIRKSASRKCYLTTPARNGAYYVTGHAKVGSRTYSSSKLRFDANGYASKKPISFTEAAKIEKCYNTSRNVWLTFDDGYISSTNLNRLLATLKKNNVKARFFFVGSWARSNPALVKRVTAAGHIVHNHSSTHPALSKTSDAGVRSQIRSGVRSSKTPRLIRPPYAAGALTTRMQALARAEGYNVCRWTVDTRDWEGPSAALMAERVRYGDATTAPVEAGGVILMHTSGKYTVSGLQTVINSVRAKGLQFERLR